LLSLRRVAQTKKLPAKPRAMRDDLNGSFAHERPSLGAIVYLRAETVPTSKISNYHYVSNSSIVPKNRAEALQDQRIIIDASIGRKICAVHHHGRLPTLAGDVGVKLVGIERPAIEEPVRSQRQDRACRTDRRRR
jgi:hypothetical protein